jgi:hypothetical protein
VIQWYGQAAPRAVNRIIRETQASAEAQRRWQQKVLQALVDEVLERAREDGEDRIPSPTVRVFGGGNDTELDVDLWQLNVNVPYGSRIEHYSQTMDKLLHELEHTVQFAQQSAAIAGRVGGLDELAARAAANLTSPRQDLVRWAWKQRRRRPRKPAHLERGCRTRHVHGGHARRLPGLRPEPAYRDGSG